MIQALKIPLAKFTTGDFECLLLQQKERQHF